ncbi:ComF family protein [Arenicella xantha]|uniref:ComF family protein n=1 Tax=Arenicella xantha TaxID=644221 RepID=A0A395JN63_9GAMM|nr:ComF family protein [Arenicella xantha]RBP53091.1 ComF family protein [Arenicella xantha]
MDFTLYNQISNGLNWLFPKRCLACDRVTHTPNIACCDNCYSKLPFQSATCRRCGQRFSGHTDHCGRCIASPPDYDLCYCPFSYESPISDQIIALKYRNHPELARDLGTLLANELQTSVSVLPELIVPVPLHLSRIRERGYNQASLLAKQVGKILDIPVDYTLLEKAVKTKNQAELSLKARSQNLNGCFKLNRKIEAQNVAIIDDVVTTGATVGEIAKILKKKGVDYIQVWGVAHTL